MLTSDVTDIYVSNKDVDGFVARSKSGGAGTFDGAWIGAGVIILPKF